MRFTILLFQIMYLIFRVVSGSNSYYCTGSNSGMSGNIHFKCIKTLCNSTSCETIIDYLDKPGPDVIIDTNNKVLLNLEIENISTIHVLFINYVRDSINSNFTMYRLLKPIVLKVQLAGPRELYKLRFINYVNGGPTEEVISKATRKNYFGCDSGNINPTCGVQYYGLNEPVPFSKGFCCSCLDSVNAARQQRSSEAVNKNNISITTNNDIVIQPRGEQDCKNISESPSYANSFAYHESAHCFRYSDLWLNVYKVEKSETVLPLTLELFKKIESSSVYVLQQQSSSSLSTNRKLTIYKNLVSYRYEVKGLNETVDNDLMAMFILIPQDIPKAYQYGLPHLNNQPAGKYLAIHPSKMSKNGGAECDKIGVEPRAFHEQPDRCYRPRGSCLGQQPIQLLRQREEDCSGEPLAGSTSGRLFVEDYVKGDISFDNVADHIIVDRQPFSSDAETPVSVQSVGEVRLDDNAVVNDKVLLQISEIHAILDNGCNNTAKLLVFVTNLGLKTAEFFIDTSGQSDLKKIEKKRGQVIVHPQQTEKIFMAFECHTNECVATVRLYANQTAATTATAVASRKFKIVRGSGCYCLWHRRCKCYQTVSPCTTGGRSLSQAQYTAAGFLGDVPPRTAVAEEAVRDRDTLVASLVLLIGYLAVALVLGLLKGMSPYRSHWLWIVGPGKRHLDAYKEPELRACPVTRDDRGYCVHPVTRSRHIRLLDRGQEFVANALFFVSLPTAAVYQAYCNLTSDCCFQAQELHSSYSTALSANGKFHDCCDFPFLQESSASENVE
ncbi:LOW QUALITY PROTEIN: hapless 2-like [Melanaphis sacchari]|uniref:LOW QUALITY PROTEIN: hapless 2-like n=1 Tax=Melanaphis sacchari TaxID=742174 RepID=UPI000DC1545C|nr:LOW QUALITY PROTEIN: hapless 2-like [Melanaphis sacchari]